MLDSSGLGVGAVVMVVQGGGSVGKMIFTPGGMDGVGMGPDGVAVEQDVVMKAIMMKAIGKWKVDGRLMGFYGCMTF